MNPWPRANPISCPLLFSFGGAFKRGSAVSSSSSSNTSGRHLSPLEDYAIGRFYCRVPHKNCFFISRLLWHVQLQWLNGFRRLLSLTVVSSKMSFQDVTLLEFIYLVLLLAFHVTVIVGCSELCSCDSCPLLYMWSYSGAVNSPSLSVPFGVFFFEWCFLCTKKNLTFITDVLRTLFWFFF